MFNKVMDLINAGKKEGAKLQTGGERYGSIGYFIKPTVFSDVKDDMRIAKEEVSLKMQRKRYIYPAGVLLTYSTSIQIFGPVQSIFRFNSLSDAIERANATSYGLAAGIITKDINTAMLFAKSVEAGSVW